MTSQITPPSTTPMMRQYLAMKERYPDEILFFRMGDFYEMFLDDAKKAAPILEIALTSRNKANSNPIPMCGIPYHAADNYIRRLIKAGLKVAICDQAEDPKTAKGIVKREVTRVVTPGTVIDSSLLDADENHFLTSIYPFKGGWGVALADITTGEFRVNEFHGPGADSLLRDEMEMVKPREVLVPESVKEGQAVKDVLSCLTGVSINFSQDWSFEYDFAYSTLIRHFKTQSLQGFGAEDLKLATCAAGAAIQYLEETQKASLSHISSLAVRLHTDHMALDSSTARNLELLQNSFDGTRAGSLLEVLGHTATSMGARMLRDWLLRPLIDIETLRCRLSAVGEFVEKSFLRQDAREVLKSVHDMERIMGRVTLGAANPRDLIALKGSLSALPLLREKIQDCYSALLRQLFLDWDDLDDMTKLIDESIADDPPITIKEGGIVKKGYSTELDQLRDLRGEGKSWIASLEAKEKEKTGISTLKIRYNRIYGYYIEITKKGLEQANIPDDYMRKQSLVNAERFISPELKEFEARVLTAEEKILTLEEDIFREIRRRVADEARRVRNAARLVATLDVCACLAEVAVRNRYVRPKMTDGDRIYIKAGRHPVIERVLEANKFVPNDTDLEPGTNQIAIITGPNMAGKSTYMRQVALIALMAQVGSFVPADEAEIGMVDRIFTRVGAQDNLSRGQSTFMVEMNEAANILNNATGKSLVILDEIGRGTSTFDGLSIAWAVVEYLHNNPDKRAKTLFATHYHELTELSGILPRVKNYNIMVREWNDEVIFLRQIAEGGADKSYGIQVARLAGLPEMVLKRAREVLSNLESREYNESGKPTIGVKKGEIRGSDTEQMSLFGNPNQALVEELRGMDINNITPLEAMKTLDKLKKMVYD